MNPTRAPWSARTALLSAVVAAAVTLSACGSSETASSDLPTLSTAASDASTGSDAAGTADEDGAVDSDAAATTDEEALLAVAQCMRDEGIDDFPDPVTGTDGSVNFDFQGMAGTVDRQSAEFERALEACGELAEGVGFGGGDRGDMTEIEDMLLEFSECMRREGVTDFPDPDFGSGQGGPFGGEIDLEDPAISPISELCQDEVNLPDDRPQGPAGEGQ